ncbi:hypothetical protein C9Z53_24850 (plasmid) [Escherichia coli]|nr:hypothetical protein C9323_24790 [Escherichia coli]TJA49492.1 hypothetical protein C9312_24845 [Escherichia coli]TJH29509.1 hypothetical protein C9156_24835 [Escherichia coli]TJH58195.1 hypothetical protein C9149_24520 [Escherichia coli]TJH69211.1 hypothetical protein C9150_24545 [Escherichia coli]
MSERHFRDVSRLVYLTAMTKAGSNADFFTAAHVFLSSGTVIQILHTGLTAGSCKVIFRRTHIDAFFGRIISDAYE